MNRGQGLRYPIGIIGGGQLARMLVQKGHELGLLILVMSERSDDPAAQVTPHWIQGSMRDKPKVRKFLSRVKVVTYESEFVLANELKDSLKKYNVKSYPKVKHMSLLQQRWSQKAWLDEYKIPTTPWVSSDNYCDYTDISRALDSDTFVIKKNMGGYDGYGTFVVSNKKAFSKIHSDLEKAETSYIAEKFIPFQRELAMTFARSSKGEIVNFPLVESFQKDSRCDWVKGPIDSSGYLPTIKKIKAALNHSGYVGVIAFEFFDLGHGKILVNEVAPRVHNTSHYSLDGFNEDQFSMHIKTILGRRLVQPKCYAQGFAMKNLIGSGKRSIDLKTDKPVHLHWYGKSENRKGRKMGHVNCLASSADKAKKIAESAEWDLKL